MRERPEAGRGLVACLGGPRLRVGVGRSWLASRIHEEDPVSSTTVRAVGFVLRPMFCAPKPTSAKNSRETVGRACRGPPIIDIVSVPGAPSS